MTTSSLKVIYVAAKLTVNFVLVGKRRTYPLQYETKPTSMNVHVLLALPVPTRK